jgi:uncharacterized iron-regulated protein
MRCPIAALALLVLASCAAAPDRAGPTPAATAALLLGEQHDAPDHQRRHHETIEALAARGALAAVTLEMAEQGSTTAGLQPHASPAQVRQALHWDEQAWPWDAYAPAVMAAVRSGVPVLGANLPRGGMREAMADTRLDALLPGPALKAQQQAIRIGHCGLLPESQIGPMTRVQIARDRAMARTVVDAAVPGKTVVLLAGAGHVDPALGVPLHLPAGFAVQPQLWPGRAPARDYCEDMREDMRRRSTPRPAS